MSWRDRLVDASFRNIQFKVANHSYGGGRRTQLHEFANREKPYLQDNGKAAETFSVEAYVIQNITNEFDYFTERDRLIKVLNQKGAGTLVHPYLGFKKVGCTGFTFTETFDEGGIARFSISFTEAGKRALPEELTNFFNNVDNAINQAMDLVGDAFVTAYSTVSLFQDTISNAIGQIMGVVSSASALTSGIATKIISESTANLALIRNIALDSVDSPIDIFNALKNSCYSMASICGMGTVLLAEQSIKGYATANGVAINDRSADIFANKISISSEITGGETGTYSGVVRGNVTELDPNKINENLGKSVINNLTNLINDFDVSSFASTPNNQASNVCLLLDTFKFQVIATICRIAIRTDFFSQEDAFLYIDQINAMIDLVLLDMGLESADGSQALGIGSGTEQINNKDIFLSIQDIRKVFVDNMTKKALSISTTIDYNVPYEVSNTLTLAYDRYMDLDRAEEIYKRNKPLINHPGFMPNGDIIRILNE
jgi:prophage DNA circulation protein